VFTAAKAQDILQDVEYARVGAHSLKLDLHRPRQPRMPLIVYVHGGAWRAGSKADVPIAPLVQHGFAIASIDYRLSPQAIFPAQIHDINAAIRFLRAKAGQFNIAAEKIAIIGSSAGGHLAALAGVSNGHKDLAGSVGTHPNESSAVQVIVSYYGASNLHSILGQSTEPGLKVRVPALQLLLGGQPDEKTELARLASPVSHLDPNAPPILLIHGDADPQMPLQQSQEFITACAAAKVPAQLVTIKGGKHGGPEFYDAERLTLVANFLKRHLISR